MITIIIWDEGVSECKYHLMILQFDIILLNVTLSTC